MKTVINHHQEVDQRIDDWKGQEKNQNALARLEGMTKEQLMRTVISAWIRNDDLEQRQFQSYRKEVDRFVEHSPRTQEKILAAIKDKPEVDHYKIARGIANNSYRNAKTFRAGQEQGAGAKFMEQFQRNATGQDTSPNQEQTQSPTQQPDESKETFVDKAVGAGAKFMKRFQKGATEQGKQPAPEQTVDR